MACGVTMTADRLRCRTRGPHVDNFRRARELAHAAGIEGKGQSAPARPRRMECTKGAQFSARKGIAGITPAASESNDLVSQG